ncbi:MAG TPA: hypothetical protein VMU09_08500 [Acidimicrobiales bacterium]|nr:hypothetical protein [Acidimicrobiales bacterium]
MQHHTRARTVEGRPSGEQEPAAAGEPAGDEPAGVGGLAPADEIRDISTSLLVLALGAGVALLLGIALLTGFFAPPGSPVSATTVGNSVQPALSSPTSSSPVGTAHVVVHSAASALAFDGGDGWLADADHATVHRFDPSTGRVTGTVMGVGQRPTAVTTTSGRVWVADSVGNIVFGLDATDGKTRAGPIEVATQPVTVAAGPGGVWVGSVLGGTVSVLDTRSGAVRSSVALPDGLSQLATGDGAVWVSGQQSSLTRVDPRPVGLLLRYRSVPVGHGPVAVAVGADGIWVACGQAATVVRVDPSTMRVTGTWRLVDGHGGTIVPSALAVFNNRVWVADGVHDTVTAIDPGTGQELGRAVAMPGPITALTTGDGSLWAATSFPGAVVRIDPA